MTLPTPPPSRPDPDVAALRLAISEERFSTYLARSAGNERLAWQLYEWGLDVATGFQVPLHALEITVRNAMHAAIAPVHGDNWLTTEPALRPGERRMVADAANRVRREGKTAGPPALIAALPFGFWVSLLANHHDQDLWRSAAYRAFRGRHRRRDLHADFELVRTLRNRVAHHEHLLNRNLSEDATRVTRLLGALNPEVALWVETRSTLSELLARRPQSPTP